MTNLKKKQIEKEEKVIDGIPKSGRVWKTKKNRTSSVIDVKNLKSSWNKKMKKRQEEKMIKALSSELKEAKKKQKEELRMRREDNKKRREENSRKAEVVQVIKNTAKIKRMKKKQLRLIEKR